MIVVVGLKTGQHVAIYSEHGLDTFVHEYELLTDGELLKATIAGTDVKIRIRRDSVEYITDGKAL